MTIFLLVLALAVLLVLNAWVSWLLASSPLWLVWSFGCGTLSLIFSLIYVVCAAIGDAVRDAANSGD